MLWTKRESMKFCSLAQLLQSTTIKIQFFLVPYNLARVQLINAETALDYSIHIWSYLFTQFTLCWDPFDLEQEQCCKDSGIAVLKAGSYAALLRRTFAADQLPFFETLWNWSHHRKPFALPSGVAEIHRDFGWLWSRKLNAVQMQCKCISGMENDEDLEALRLGDFAPLLL